MSGIMHVWASVAPVTNPNQLPNIGLWYNATDGSAAQFTTQLTNGQVVTQWVDLSGAGHDGNKSGGSLIKPSWMSNVQNGKGAVLFTASETDSLNVNPILWAQNLAGSTVYVVARALTLDATNRTIVTTNATEYNISWNGSNWRVGGGGGIGVATGLAGDTTKFHIFGSVFDGSKIGNSNRLTFRYDGTPQTLNFGATTVGTTTSGSASYMYFGTDNTTYFNGYIGTVMIWERALNAAECLQVEGYLKTVWATP